MKRCYLLLTALIFCFHGFSQDIKLLKLKQQKVDYAPRNYFVAGVKDDRADTSSMGTMRAGLLNKVMKINLSKGVPAAIAQFLSNNLEQDRSKAPVELHITSLDISEKVTGFKEQADLSMGIAFYSNGSLLIEYKGSAYVRTGMDASAYIEQLIRQNLERSLQEFDEWFDLNKDAATGKPAVNISLQFIDSAEDPDELVYSKKPLSWEDFKGLPDKLSLGSAATYSGIGLKYSSKTRGGKVDVEIYLSAYFNGSKSWYKAGSRNSKVLKHEQKHFDITALVACELAQEIRNTTFFVESYSKELEALHRKYVKKLEERQAAYDDATNHGGDIIVQKKWEFELEEELSKTGCF